MQTLSDSREKKSLVQGSQERAPSAIHSCTSRARTPLLRLGSQASVLAALFVSLAVAIAEDRPFVSCVRSVVEDGIFEIVCDNGTIVSVDWARYGRATALAGTCEYSRNPQCDADVLKHFSHCPGSARCVVETGNTPFGGGDPCHNYPKWTAVVFSCSAPPPRPPIPPAQPPPPPPPEPPTAPPFDDAPGGFRCALLPLAEDGTGHFIMLDSVRQHASLAPNRPQGPEGEPFDCIPSLCSDSFVAREACTRRSLDREVRWGGATFTECGEGYKGWRLDWSDVVIGIPVAQTFFGRLDEQARAREICACSERLARGGGKDWQCVPRSLALRAQRGYVRRWAWIATRATLPARERPSTSPAYGGTTPLSGRRAAPLCTQRGRVPRCIRICPT